MSREKTIGTVTGSTKAGPSATRRSALKMLGGAGLAALAVPGSVGFPRLGRASAQEASSIVSWAPAGPRFEFPQRGVLPLFQGKFPNINVDIAVDPLADFFPKTAIAMSSKSDRYDAIFEDYLFVPQFIAQGALESIEPYLDQDPEFKNDILADIPSNVLDTYRDKPASEGGKLYGLPPDSNCQLQYYRADVFEKAGLKPAVTWEDAIEISRELSDNGKRPVVGTTLKRGNWSAGVFIMLLRSYGGNWFDSMGPGGWHVTLDTEEGQKAFDVLMRLLPYLDPTSLNAADDEANTAMLNGTWVFAPAQWAGSTMNDPQFTQFAEYWKVTVVPKGTGPNGRHAPAMGGLGFLIPSYSKNKDAAWEWIKFCCSGDRQDPAIGKAWVESTGQPARLSLLKQYTNIRPYFAGLNESMPFAVPFPTIPEMPSLQETVGTQVGAVLTGQKSPDDALKDMQVQVTSIMEKGGYYKT